MLILGPSGVGKPHLASALGVRAVTNGFTVWFVTADELIEMLRRDEQAPATRIRQRRYLTSRVLVIDEVGFPALDRVLHHCHVLSIDGASYRLRHLEAHLAEA